MSFLKSLFAGTPPRSVILQPSNRTFTVGKNESILECALKEGINYPHECTVGTCGSCRTKLLNGKVEAITPFSYTLSKEELAAGYILACQAMPQSDVLLEVDLSNQKIPEPRQMSARLVESRDLTHDIKRVTWETDAPMLYLAGQYMNIRWPGGPDHRSYSFCEAPLDGGRTRVSAFIRRVPGGAFSEMLFGDETHKPAFEIDGPHGNFWLRDGTGPLICIAGGSGLSPLMSLLEDALQRSIKRDVILLFGARGQRDLYCQSEVANLAEKWPARFSYWPALSEEKNDTIRSGFVTEHIPAALAELGAGTQAYMCGPPGMIDAAIMTLTANGISIGDIHYDKFTDASHEAPVN